ncbi:chemotaxis protein CheW [Geobacter sp. OR-1]|uniref:chemotaxis protein CheW n=1 Tax=Geobacter sp. OR-1 TaxID=1266765 RepID=UPI0005420BDF|nr:chemotaxis protein CheW [Geobacter sp. OR-1]GAM09192.1 chemotaxis protein CheW [Geobacter sp. OR-1]
MADDKFPSSIVSILDGMRDEYWQELTESAATPQELLECVLFRLGNELFAFETPFASEVIRMPKLVKVPRLTGVFAGVFNLHGEITLAIDICPLLGLPPSLPGKSSRLLIVKSPLFKTGILTDAVLEVTDLSFSSFSPSCNNDGNLPAPFIRGEFQANSVTIKLLDISCLLNSPEIIINQTSLFGEELISEIGTEHDS